MKNLSGDKDYSIEVIVVKEKKKKIKQFTKLIYDKLIEILMATNYTS